LQTRNLEEGEAIEDITVRKSVGEFLHCVSKKRPTLSFALTLTNIDGFSKFLQCIYSVENLQ